MTNVVSVLGVNKKYVVIPSQYKCQQGWIEIVVSIPAVYMSCMSYVTYVICHICPTSHMSYVVNVD